MHFVDLNRDFVPVPKNQPVSPDVGRAWGRRIGGWLDWTALAAHRRVILLAEAGSGKTEEFRHQRDLLQAGGKAAFFLRIEDLVDHGFRVALDSQDAARFEAWIGGTTPGWFFLDSVDEARLARKSFQIALQKFARELGDGLDRAHVYVSCRISDWKGEEDRRLAERLLPCPEPVARPEEAGPDADRLLDPIFTTKPPAKGKKTGDHRALTIVQLLPLSPLQYRQLAEAAGVIEVNAFARAIQIQRLDALTERPNDVLDLADYWRTHGRFGPYGEMVEHGIARKLKEAQSDRADNDVLSQTEARAGACRIAAALTLAKAFTLKTPHPDPDRALSAGALDVADVLPDWTEAKRAALLRRAIFAPATYGRIRFHHRSSQEYLAADWLHRLLDANCPIAEVWKLLFAERYGIATVVPSLRPVAAWLACWRPEFRDEILRREPLVLLNFGDPGTLPMASREALISAYATRHAAGEIAENQIDQRSLGVFADPRLADAIRRAWRTNSRAEFRSDLLQLVREGPIPACADLARGLALDTKASRYQRALAMEALAACVPNDAGLATAARRLVRSVSKTDSRAAARFALVLFPKHLTTAQLLTLIEKSTPPPRNSGDGFGYLLRRLYDACPTPRDKTDFCAGLADLALRQPFVDIHHRVSTSFRWLARHLHDIAVAEMRRCGTQPPDAELIRLLMVTERIDRSPTLDEDPENLVLLVRGNPALLRALFWADLAELRANGPLNFEIVRYWQIYLGGRTLWDFGPSDLDWLLTELADRPEEKDKRIVLSAIFSVLRDDAARRDTVVEGVRALIESSPVLQADVHSYLAPPEPNPELLEHEARRRKWQTEQKAQSEQNKASWRRFAETLAADPNALSDPAKLASWKAGSYRLYDLYYWLRRRSDAHDERALRDWRLLEEGFGRPVADAFRKGLRHLWRQAKPRGPRRGEGGLITYFKENELAFGAIGVDAAENIEWAGKLSAAEVRQAARHGTLSNIRYPEWIDDLLGALPQIVVPILKKQLREEWTRTTLSQLYFINHYASPVAQISPALQKAFLEVILAEEAGALAGLNSAVDIVRKLDLDDAQRSALRAMARKRMQSYRRRNPEYGLRYLAVLLLLEIDTSAKYLTAWIERGDPKSQQVRAEEAFTALFGRDSALAAGSLESASIATLENLLLLAYRHIAMADDEVHEGSYSPGRRDHAEQARNAILSAIINRPGADAYRLLQRASGHASFALRAERFRELARGKAERDTEIAPWTASDVLVFEREHFAPLKTGHDLLGVVVATLRDVAFRLIHGDATSRPLLARAQNEDEVQNWLAEQIKLMSKRRFHAHREAQVANAKKPDIIVSSTAAPVEVAIEIKHGDKGWSVNDLEDAIETQLAKTYLKPETRRHGVLVVTNHRDRIWINPETRKQMRFSELIDRLSRLAQSIVHNGIGSVEIECIGIDAWSSRGQVKPRPTQKRAASASAGSLERAKPIARKAASTRNVQNGTGRKKK